MIERFKDFEVWQLSRELVNVIYQKTELVGFLKDFDLRRQISRASISILSNIAEGFERKSNKEFVFYLFIAKGSLGEVRSQLYISKDFKYISDNDFENIMKKLEVISKSLSGFIKYLRYN